MVITREIADYIRLRSKEGVTTRQIADELPQKYNISVSRGKVGLYVNHSFDEVTRIIKERNEVYRGHSQLKKVSRIMASLSPLKDSPILEELETSNQDLNQELKSKTAEDYLKEFTKDMAKKEANLGVRRLLEES